jgi:glycolate oxidase FAD binding subunit
MTAHLAGARRSRAVDAALWAFAEEVGEADPVAVEGGRTSWSAGGDVVPGTRLVRAPSGIVKHQPEEMIVRVRAGTTVAELHEVLGAAGQRTALPERGGPAGSGAAGSATVGGALALGQNCLSVPGRGQVRHCVLQVVYVSAEGRLVTGGAPTVKNVSGFDLPKLMVGSLGTLGLLAEVVLRTNPVPEVVEWWSAEGADPFAVWREVARPSVVLWDGNRTWVELEGYRVDVAPRVAKLASLGTWHQVEGPPTLEAYRWSLRPADLIGLGAGVTGASAPTLGIAGTGAFVASVGVGTVWAGNPQPPRPVDPGVQQLARRVKEEFDPTGRLNPGRDPMAVR